MSASLKSPSADREKTTVPWVVWGFFKIITPFIDPLTREKLKFNEDMSQYVPKETLWSEFSTGSLEFEYDHSVYWPALHALCKERRDKRHTRWVAGGKQVGELEDYLSGVADKGVGGDPAAVAAAAVVEAALAAPATAEAPAVVEAASKEVDGAVAAADTKTDVDVVEEKVKDLKVAA
jgi:hypothetical protein